MSEQASTSASTSLAGTPSPPATPSRARRFLFSSSSSSTDRRQFSVTSDSSPPPPTRAAASVAAMMLSHRTRSYTSPGWSHSGSAVREVQKANSTDAGDHPPTSAPDTPARPGRNKDSAPLLKCHSADEGCARSKAAITRHLTTQDTIFEDREVSPGVSMKGASVEKLAEEVLKEFERRRVTTEDQVDPTNAGVGACSDSTRSSAFTCDTAFPLARLVFLMHKWFIPSVELAHSMMDLCREVGAPLCPATAVDPGKSLLRFGAGTLCQAFSYWICTYPMDFHHDNQLFRLVADFSDLMDKNGVEEACGLTGLLKSKRCWLRGYSLKRSHGQTVSQQDEHKEDSNTLVFKHISPSKLADQLTVLEFKLFRRITVVDLKNYAVTGSLKESKHLESSIALFNGLSQWVQCMILYKTTPAERAKVVVKFVDVSKALFKQQNYNTLYAVIGGITHSSIARLSKTMGALPAETQKILTEYTEFLSSSNNFSIYRRKLSRAQGFCIPILGVYLKDIVFFNTAVSDFVGEGSRLINCSKMVQLYSTFAHIVECQQNLPPIEEDTELCNTLRLSLDLHYTEDEIYELSLAREPRNAQSPSTPTKSVVFSDWVAGVKPPHPETLKKHVHDMVEAVYKVYDKDKNGMISHAEFDQIAENFPFIDSFAVLDADNDGAISKAEMKNYFIRANCHALRNSFKHDFHETTYFKPTFCAHCTGLLWGLIKQGWRCRDCGLNAHKHCKDIVVMECRNRIHPAIHSRTSSSLPSDAKVIERRCSCSPVCSPRSQRHITPDRKRRMSLRHKRSTIVNTSCQTDVGVAGTSTGCATEFYEDSAALYDRLIKTEEEVSSLQKENTILRERLESQEVQNSNLRSHIRTIRQKTIGFILNLMDTLNLQQDSEV